MRRRPRLHKHVRRRLSPRPSIGGLCVEAGRASPASGDAATLAAISSGVRGAIRESGGTRRVAASGVGMPFALRTVTNASPIPSEVRVRSTS